MRSWTAVFALILVTGCGAARPVPAGFEQLVASARASLLSEDDDPTAIFDFLEMRCRADGGRLVAFEQRSFFASLRFAYAMQGPNASGWGGGLRVASLEDDSEIAYFFSKSPEAPCPPPG